MLAESRQSLPLLAPTLEKRGPYRPGERIPVLLPLRNLGTTVHHNVTVRFHGEAVQCDPEFIELAKLGPDTEHVRSTATVLPLNGKRTVRVWAEVTLGDLTLHTGEARGPIAARSDLRLKAIEDDGVTEITVVNRGDAPTDIRIILETAGEPACDILAFTRDANGRYRSDSLAVAAQQECSIIVEGSRIEFVVVEAADGERTSTRPTREETPRYAMDAPAFTVDAPKEGVRDGDLIPFHVTLYNSGNVPISDASLELALSPQLQLVERTVAVDDVLLLAQDISVDGAVVQIRPGYLEAGASSTVRGALQLHLPDPRDLDHLTIVGHARTEVVPHFRLEANLPIDRRPAFTSATTFLGRLERQDDGLVITATITNAEPRPIERVRLRWTLTGLKPHRAALLNDDVELVLRPTSLDDAAAVFVELGTLDANSRSTVSLHVKPERTDAPQRSVRVTAALVVDEHVIDLGTSEESLPGAADLRASRLDYEDRPLRLGLPIEASLLVQNTGDAPARDVRIAFELPTGVHVTLPDPSSGRWRPLIPLLPAGGSVGTTITIYLSEPPNDTHLTIPVSLDADGYSAISLPALSFHTPSAPLIDPPTIETQALEHGHLLMVARIANIGDGPARNVCATVLDPDHILPASTHVDTFPIDDLGTRSSLSGDLSLGDLPAGAYRTLSWTVAPPSDAPYRTSLRISIAGEAVVTGVSIPCRPRRSPQFAKHLPDPRRIDGRPTLDRMARRPVARVDFAAPLEPVELASVQTSPALSDTEGSARALPAGSANPSDDQQSSLLAHEPGSAGVTTDDLRPPTPATPLTPESGGQQDSDVATNSTVHGEEEPAAPSIEEESHATVEPVELRLEGRPDIERATLVCREALSIETAGWWTHVLALRAFLADQVPGNDEAQQLYAKAKSLLQEPLTQAYPAFFVEKFVPTQQWVDVVGRNDEQALRLVEEYLALSGIDNLDQGGLGASRLDSLLPLLLPDRLEDPTATRAMLAYKNTARATLAYPALLQQSPTQRIERYSSRPNATLDELLVELLHALDS